MLPIPDNLPYPIEEKTWGKSVDTLDEKNQTEGILNGHITCVLRAWNMMRITDRALWNDFREEFDGWTQDTLKVASKTALKMLRLHLTTNGVWIKIAIGVSYAKGLYDCLQEDTQHEWTKEDIEAHLKEHPDNFNSRWNPARGQSSTIHLNAPAARAISVNPPDLQTPQPSIAKPHVERTDHGWEEARSTTLDTAYTGSHIQQQPSHDRAQQNTQDMPLPRMVEAITRQYSNTDDKYGGGLYDDLNTKLVRFYDICEKIGLREHQFHIAFSLMLKGKAEKFYFTRIKGKAKDFPTMVEMMRAHFDTEENRQRSITEWREATFPRIIAQNPEKSRSECLEILFETLEKIQPGLPPEHRSETTLREQTINACRGVEECKFSIYRPASTLEGVQAELRSAVANATLSSQSGQFQAHEEYDVYDQHWTDRTYGGRGRGYSRGGYNQRRGSYGYGSNRELTPFRGSGPRGGYRGSPRGNQGSRQGRCYICGRPGCWSKYHTGEERKRSLDNFRQQHYFTTGQTATPQAFQMFISDFEGTEKIEGLDDSDSHDPTQMLATITIEDDKHEGFVTELGEVDGTRMISILNDQAVYHFFTKDDIFQQRQADGQAMEVFTLDNRYSSDTFQGIMPDTGASGVSSAGEPQFRALCKLDPKVKLNTFRAAEQKIKFGDGDPKPSLGTADVDTPIGTITFHILPTNTPFLFCLKDMDAMGVELRNKKNVLERGDKRVPIVRKWGHPWMLLHNLEEIAAWSHLTETELRQLHRRFGHPSVRRLTRILQRAGHDVNSQCVDYLTKFCHHCQMKGKSPGRFKFTLKDDYEFNYSVIVDVLYLEGKPVLQVIDAATSFGAARFLRDMSARNSWDTLRACWIDTYQGPPDYVVHDAGKNFISTEFKQLASSMSIKIKEVPVEAHNSVGKVERYHAPLRRAYEILREELKDENIDREMILQMAVKAINDSAGPDGIIPTLLVFGAYPRMTEMDPPSPSVVKRAEAIRAATKEVRRLHAERQVNDALAIRNGPNIITTLNLPLQSDVRVWREKGGWKGPYKLLAVNGETCTVDMPHGPTNFRSTIVKPYYREECSEAERGQRHVREDGDQEDKTVDAKNTEEPDKPTETQRRGRGRPPGSKNKPKPQVTVRRSTRQNAANPQDLEDQFINTILEEQDVSMALMTNKERADMELSIKLRSEGVITTPGLPFDQSRKEEIDGLIARGVFDFVQYDPIKHAGIRIFNSRLVNEIKGKATGAPFEKSRLVIQAYNDEGKGMILTQSPTIQRASQRVIVALAPSLREKGISLSIRDITQAYVQSTTSLNRLILAHLPKETKSEFPTGTIMVVRKPLYGIPEAGTHWWATYHKHHRERLGMVTSTYDPCLLISTAKGAFGVVGMQTDDTLILGSDEFAKLEEKELVEAKFSAKPKDTLSPEGPLIFNGCVLTQNDGDVAVELRQKEQGKRLKPIDHKSTDFKHVYMEQRARGAYIATICQPEAAFDLSVAAQHQDPTEADVNALNKRIMWQMKNLDRGIKYIAIDLSTAKLFVFVDGSFANNKDFSSQIGYEIILANESTKNEEFEITGNLIHWSSTKSKRVTRSVLASEIYGMVGGVDMAIAIGTTIKMIMDQLGFEKIPTIVCTDSYSLYECLVKLGTTKEKRLMIDIMALRQSYERREIMEIRWINGSDNPADAMTKADPNKALEKFISTNTLRVRVEGWVERQ
ncbi:hypothetical protein N7509_012727 [Penicillium cosmopolitanum]|uniref:Integrase catalytic domain-containing protein n=2 Tax=Penicillium cosmopolitanum TaxID=1131564 RepID=A0A9W9SJD9_9EURO|nr:uncharacterized protein N7509_012727 [Penicillium cosmopolitanum]KAJ5379608.1 hypothetical protein N7509_012727 [Penicillium cosmopolitanum]